MSDEQGSSPITTPAADEQLSFWARHRFVVLLAGATLIALVLTTISITIYYRSGAAQLDLSRPGYRSVSDKVEKDTTDDSFSASGAVTKDVIEEFIKLYDAQAAKAKGVDAFNGDPLNPEVLEFGSAAGE